MNIHLHTASITITTLHQGAGRSCSFLVLLFYSCSSSLSHTFRTPLALKSCRSRAARAGRIGLAGKRPRERERRRERCENETASGKAHNTAPFQMGISDRQRPSGHLKAAQKKGKKRKEFWSKTNVCTCRSTYCS